jgi:DNA-binding beta-propeller fold protein YncE
MQQQHRWTLALAVVALSIVAGVRAKDHEDLGPYRLIKTVLIPGFGNGFDISWVDSAASRYYLADRGNTAVTPAVPPRIDVIDTRSLKLLDPLPVHAAGNGVVAIRTTHSDDDRWSDEGANELWVGDAKSNVEVIDLASRAIVADIPTGGSHRADELAYDPRHHIILVANDQDTPPFVTFISTTTRTVLGHLSYPQAVFGPEPPPRNNHGLEQPVWNPKTKKFYLSVPGTETNPQGEVDEIDPIKMDVTRVFPAVCNPNEAPQGLALIPRQRLATSCGDIIRIKDGKVLTTIPGVGIDEIWFNPGDERVYYAGGPNFILDPSVPVVDTDTNTLVAVIKVGTPPPPLRFTHSVAADSELNRIFVPISGVGVKVYTDNEEEDSQ